MQTKCTTVSSASVQFAPLRKAALRNTPTSHYVPIPNAVPVLKGVEIVRCESAASKNHCGGDEDSLKIVGNRSQLSSGSSRKEQQLSSKVARSSAFSAAKSSAKYRHARLARSASAPLHVSTNQQQDGETPRPDVVDKNENSDNQQGISQIRMRYKTRTSEKTSGKTEESVVPEVEGTAAISRSDQMIKQEDLSLSTEADASEEQGSALPEKSRHLSSVGSLSSVVYKNDGLQFDANWQERMVERYRLLHEQRKYRQQSAASKRSAIRSEKTKAHAIVSKHNRQQQSSFFNRSPSSEHQIRPVTSVDITPRNLQAQPSLSSSNTYRLSFLSEDETVRAHVSTKSNLQLQRNGCNTVLPLSRPRSSCSIPGKMSYVLVEKKKSRSAVSSSAGSRSMNECTPLRMSKLEHELMQLRFPARYQLIQKALGGDRSKQRPGTVHHRVATSSSPLLHRKSSHHSSSSASSSPLICMLHRKHQSYTPTSFS